MAAWRQEVPSWQSGTAYPWAVVLRSTDQFLGVIELRIHPPKADFGYIFCEEFWGLGFATGGGQCVVDWALTQPEIFRVWATCDPDNTASARVLAKAGLKLEARLENWEARPQRVCLRVEPGCTPRQSQSRKKTQPVQALRLSKAETHRYHDASMGFATLNPSYALFLEYLLQ